MIKPECTSKYASKTNTDSLYKVRCHDADACIKCAFVSKQYIPKWETVLKLKVI